jgi:hypothetical protein
MKESKKSFCKRLTVFVKDEQTWEKLVEAAKKEYRSPTNYVEVRIIEDQLRRYEGDNKN